MNPLTAPNVESTVRHSTPCLLSLMTDVADAACSSIDSDAARNPAEGYLSYRTVGRTAVDSFGLR